MRHPVVLIIGSYVAPSAWLRELNIRKAETLIFQLAIEGCTPLCPHTMNRFLFGTLDETTWRELILEFVYKADAILVTSKGELKKSEGTRIEHALALRLGKPVFFTMEEVRRFMREWNAEQETWSSRNASAITK